MKRVLMTFSLIFAIVCVGFAQSVQPRAKAVTPVGQQIEEATQTVPVLNESNTPASSVSAAPRAKAVQPLYERKIAAEETTPVVNESIFSDAKKALRAKAAQIGGNAQQQTTVPVVDLSLKKNKSVGYQPNVIHQPNVAEMQQKLQMMEEGSEAYNSLKVQIESLGAE